MIWWIEAITVLVFAMGWWPCCCDAECTVACTNCTTGRAPCDWQVEISGVVNDFCTGCGDINGTYITPTTVCIAELFVSRFTTWSNLEARSGGVCVALSENGTVRVTVSGNFSSDALLVTIAFGGGSITWKTSHPGGGAKVVCEVAALDIPYNSGCGAPLGEDCPCDASLSTCTLTALT